MSNQIAVGKQPQKKRIDGEFVMVAVMALLALWMLSGHWTIDIIGETIPGPLFMPTLVGVLALIIAVALTIDILIKPRKAHDSSHNVSQNVSTDLLDDLAGFEDSERKKDDAQEESTPPVPSDDHIPTDWKTFGLVILCFVVTIIVLPYLGWTITSSLLFFTVSQILGKGSIIRDLAISFIIGSITYLIFAIVLGLNLPAGIFGGI